MDRYKYDWFFTWILDWGGLLVLILIGLPILWDFVAMFMRHFYELGLSHWGWLSMVAGLVVAGLLHIARRW